MISYPNPNPDEHLPLVQGIDVSLGLSNNNQMIQYFDILTHGKYDENGEYSVEVRDPTSTSVFNSFSKKVIDPSTGNLVEIKYHLEPKIFMVLTHLHHPGLAEVSFSTFFHQCKLENIFFDYFRQDGSQFVLYDSIQSALVGLFTVGCHRKQAIQRMVEAVGFFQNQAGSIPEAIILRNGQDTIHIRHVAMAISAINRALELKQNHGRPFEKKKQSFTRSVI